MRVCDNCKRDPTPFKTNLDETGYWFAVPKSTLDPVVLMSSLESKFLICTERDPPPDGKEYFLYCDSCLCALLGYEDD